MASMELPSDPRLRRLELAGVVLLLFAAAFVRGRDLRAPFDRAVDGFQGSCFAVFAVNYERVGIARYGGYPVFNVDLPSDPETPLYVYANHPPLVPLLGWSSLQLLGPEGWGEAWREGRAPEGIEGALRLPFFLLHVLGLWALWWALRPEGAQRALLALALAAVAPIGILCAGLVNYENACIPPLLVALGFHARWLASGARRHLFWCAAFGFLASLVTFTPLFFAPALVLHALWARGWRRALAEGAAFGAAALVPLVSHGLWVRWWVPEAATSVWARAETLLAPLFDGSAPLSEWARRQVVRLSAFHTPWILAAAGAGVALLAWRALRRGAAARAAHAERPISVVPPLVLGAFLSQLAFYRHTFDGSGALDGQTNFLLNLTPAVAAAAAVAFDALGHPLQRLRGGFAPLVALVALAGLPAVARSGAIRTAWRAPGPLDDPSLTSGPDTPLPSTAGRQIAEVLPSGAVGLFPTGAILGPATSFYSWRTLLNVSDELWGQRMRMIEDVLGLDERYLLFPRHSAPAVRQIVERYRPGLVERFGAPLATNEGWELWPPEP